jgi:hypothetical protein
MNPSVIACRERPPIEVLKETWPIFKQHLGLTLGVPVLLVVVPGVLVIGPCMVAAFILFGASALLSREHTPNLAILVPFIGLCMLLFAVVYNLIRVGWTKIIISLANGEPAAFSDLKKALPSFVGFLVTMFLVGVGTFVGSLFFVIPGVFFAVRTCLAPFLVVEKGLRPIEAIVESNRLVTGYSWQILLYYLLLLIANAACGMVPIVGHAACVGVLGFFDLALAKVYVMRRSALSPTD